jgi:hypothetical protein
LAEKQGLLIPEPAVIDSRNLGATLQSKVPQSDISQPRPGEGPYPEIQRRLDHNIQPLLGRLNLAFYLIAFL